ncbi:hypothetical protein [Comamonas sp. B-9]|uniref:hypothetical protein n=1 Tax=Comamonas sp. B-9 TaxID=1055192 RepID=UPI000395D921|nr:hypothetical protein [Comamonas sp. B-9]
MTNNVFSADFQKIRNSLPSGTEPPDNGDMEQRVAKLESLAEKTGERLVALEKSSALILQKQEEFARHFATKADVEAVKTAVATSTSTIIKWVVGAVVFSQLIPVLATWLPKILGPTP